jgi:predicted unusual protein kinase regulating ubiquinone biosynthesis (AarF/ABC1/UbiB family)
VQLGPTFIKFGQLLSTRIDILPKEYTEELSLLQDNVPGFSGEVSKRIIEEDFGKPVEELFDSFDVKPIAAASLGQVHRARLNGEELAVKVQRQGLRDLFDLDLKNLKVLAILLDKFDPKTDGAARDWLSIYEESARLLYKEIDYENEGRNANRFKENFKDFSWVKVRAFRVPSLAAAEGPTCRLASACTIGPAVMYTNPFVVAASWQVPDVYWNYTSKRVLTMEYCPGIKISDIARIEEAGIDRKVLAKRSAESYLTQLCRYD